MVVLDITFLVALEKGSAGADGVHDDLLAGVQARRIPAAVWVEYLAGFAPLQRERAERTLEAAGTFEPFTRLLADEAARLQFELLRAGDALAWHDLQIATTALHYHEPLVTSDARFRSVPGLALVEH